MVKNTTIAKKSQTASKIDDSQLHWFWRITSKHSFFLYYHILLAFIIGITLIIEGLISKDYNSFTVILVVLASIVFLMPVGLLYVASIPCLRIRETRIY